MKLEVETAIARAAGRLSRLAGRGGGTTLPGKILTSIDGEAIGRLAARLPRGAALVSATNGKTTTSAMVAEILRPHVALAHNREGANLASGIASALMDAGDAELALLEVDEGAFPAIARQVRPRAVLLGNLFRDQLDRYGELELIAERWRYAVAGLDPSATVVVNVDDPLLAELARDRPGVVRFGVDDPSVARERLPHAADSKYCVRCGAPYLYDAAYVGHLGDYRCPNGDPGRRSTSQPGRSSSRASSRPASSSRRPRARRRSPSNCPASTTSTTPSPRRRSRWRSGWRSTTSPKVSRASARRSGASSASRPETAPCSSC
jgi:UDP-N-acetylmuramyl tripeptide synthase